MAQTPRLLQTVTYFMHVPLTQDFWSYPGKTVQKTKTNTIRWDPAVSTLVSAKLHSIISDCQSGMTGQIYFNGAITNYCDARFGTASIDETIDVSINNGVNSVKIELTSFVSYGSAWYTVELLLEFAGVDPDVTEPQEDVFPWELILYAVLGIASIIAVAYAIRAIKS